jgi:hypothetical protein
LATGPIPPWAALLARFYRLSGRTLPRFDLLQDYQVPPPYHSLLAHSSDMTLTLERFYHQPLRLSVLSRDLEADSYQREVVLTPAQAARPVEYGVIRICLGRLSPRTRRRVLEEQQPLGAILLSEAIPHLSWPQAFFRVQSDRHMAAVLDLPNAGVLYGRRTVLLDGARRLLADVLEVLAPVENHSPSPRPPPYEHL